MLMVNPSFFACLLIESRNGFVFETYVSVNLLYAFILSIRVADGFFRADDLPRPDDDFLAAIIIIRPLHNII